MRFSPVNMQIVSAADDNARCRNCGRDLSKLGSFQYVEPGLDAPKYRLEKNRCHCGKEFLLRYSLFDRYGHVNKTVFNTDINDDAFQWQSLWNNEQINAIETHMANCQVCRDRHDEVLLEDAAFGALIHSMGSMMIGDKK